MTDVAHTTTDIMTPQPVHNQSYKWMIGLNGALMMSECCVVMGERRAVCVCVCDRINELEI